MWTIFSDTDSDLNLEHAARYGCKLISMPYSVDTRTVYPYEDFETFESKQYYDMLRAGVIPTTSAVSEQRYIDYFEPEFAAGNDIFYIHFSAAMTMTFNNMHNALDKLKAKYPERRFLELDTKGITIVSYLVFREAMELIDSGKSPEEVVEWGKTEVDHYAQYFFADDLKFFRRSGRVSGIAATMGGLIGVRPIIYMNEEGKMLSIGTEKGRRKAMERLLSYVEQKGDDIKNHHFIIGHTDAPELVEELKGKLYERFGNGLEIEVIVTNPTAGAHCGPNGVGVAFHSKER